MYQSHWGLTETPFQNGISSRAFYQSPTHEEALARLYFLVEQRHRLGILLGEGGSGKSLLLNLFAAEVRRAGRPAVLASLLGLDASELLATLATGLGLNPDRDATRPVLWRMLTDRLREYRYQQLETVLLFDDADRGSRDVLTAIARLVRHDASTESRLTIVLAGRPDRMGRLGPDLLDLAALRIDLEAWERPETESYITTCLTQAGRTQPVFDEPAVARLHELSQGVPRRINQLAELALLAGAGRDLEMIDAETIDSVCRDLGAIEV